ncbi:amyloid fiber anchoring/assembly protein TapA [Oceanobacillus damuensis]|uniref:amyloid fiber anchoring/assembly protein TapA n=1 Tax=Oceanobacillus damuensis TaxID=937928 RepID=UPI00082AABC0|nr:amyloid fiber anchoring/assembly protein TapA [Oceanobacillus damuensis]
MRSSRLNKFKQKNQLFLLLLKASFVWYILLFSSGYLATDTAAYFTAYQETSGMVSVGKWESPEENSTLRFVTKGNKNIKACEPVIIAAELKNDGPGDMKENGSYDVYYIENGNPEKHGEKLDLHEEEGIISSVRNGETVTLTHEASKPGVYVFSTKEIASDTDSKIIWSKWTIVNCPSSNSAKEEQSSEGSSSVPNEANEAEESEIQEKEEDNSVEQVESTDINESTESSADEQESAEEDTTDMNQTEEKVEAAVESDVPSVEEQTNQKDEDTTNEQDGGEE